MLKYSRHSKRRMALYGISEEDVAVVVKEGQKESLAQAGRVSFTWALGGKFRFPIKVVGLERGSDILVITAYPLRKGRGWHEGNL